MCGICGYIGESKNPEITFDLATHLFEKTEIRGEDAAGLWGVVDDRKVVYHKEPVKSSVFVKRPMWAKIGELHPNLLICHARAASMGVGVPAINKNNHPFISRDGRIGLVHNGRIPDVEYKALKKKFPTLSNCDSEILLRIFEAGRYSGEERTKEFNTFDDDVASRLTGLKDIWSFLSLGHMAVAIGETKGDGVRRLWLFRNKHRSLWLADMRKPLGQVFFFSVPQIWRAAVDDTPGIKPFLSGGIKLIELPPEEIWMFNTSPELALTKRQSLKRFEVCASGSYNAMQEEQIVATLPSAERTAADKVELITELGEDEKEPAYKKEEERTGMGFQYGNRSAPFGFGGHNHGARDPITSGGNSTGQSTALVLPINQQDSVMTLPTEDIEGEDIDKLCDGLSELASQIKTVFGNKLTEGSVSVQDFQDLKQSLEQTELDMEATLRIVDR